MDGHVTRDPRGDVTIGVPTALNASDAPLPGVPGAPPEFAVHVYDDKPVVYQRAGVDRPPVEMVFTFEGQPVLYTLYEGEE